MQVIHEANKDISRLWGKGEVSSTAYRMLVYTIAQPVGEGTLLHNVVTGEMVLLDAEEAEKLSTLPCEYASWMDNLIQKRFLVRTEMDDKKCVDELRSVFQVVETADGLNSYKVLPTTHCNAHCFYCVESNVTNRESMSDETADKLAEFMIAHKGKAPLRIHWFGGEPLVGIRQIDRICGTLRDRKTDFSSSMTSNGYLLDEDTCRRAKEDWRLKSIQITLDGTEKIYNETKAYKNADGSPYQKVLRNMGFLLNQGVNVIIRLNMGLHNIDDLNLLIEELSERFCDKTNLTVYSRLLFEDCGFVPTHFSSEEYRYLREERRKLEEKIAQHSLRHPLKPPHLKINRCQADNDVALLVAPSGKIGKCDLYFDERFVGDLQSGVTNTDEVKSQKERLIYPECAACRLYPSCIKLKICLRNNSCNGEIQQGHLEEAARAMMFIYEEHLRSESRNATPKQQR